MIKSNQNNICVQSIDAVFFQKGASHGFANSTDLHTLDNRVHVAIIYSKTPRIMYCEFVIGFIKTGNVC